MEEEGEEGERSRDGKRERESSEKDGWKVRGLGARRREGRKRDPGVIRRQRVVNWTGQLSCLVINSLRKFSGSCERAWILPSGSISNLRCVLSNCTFHLSPAVPLSYSCPLAIEQVYCPVKSERERNFSSLPISISACPSLRFGRCFSYSLTVYPLAVSSPNSLVWLQLGLYRRIMTLGEKEQLPLRVPSLPSTGRFSERTTDLQSGEVQGGWGLTLDRVADVMTTAPPQPWKEKHSTDTREEKIRKWELNMFC